MVKDRSQCGDHIKGTVRTHSFLSSVINTLFGKKREKQFTIMAKKTKKQENDATMYKVSENEQLFAMAKTKEGVIILLGKFKVSSKTFKNYEEAEEYIKSKPYELIINVTTLFVKFNLQNNETESKNPQDK